MKSIGKCLSEKYVLNGIIESHFSDAYAYIFDYMFNFILYNLSLLTLGFLFHHPIAVTIYIIITGSLRAVTGGYHCKTRISCYILSYTVFSIYLLTIATIPMISAYILIPIYIICWILILVVSPSLLRLESVWNTYIAEIHANDIRCIWCVCNFIADMG